MSLKHINSIMVSEAEVLRMRNIFANIYMDMLGHNDIISNEAKQGLDLTIKILEEYHGERKNTR